ncbi:hypothetical protein [Paracidobacterium acidisoli]|nr:hypothetical protein [Paracidobacterium acidisoli]MBT9331437.1 hypothetical protein [Paracidobacterium acidisoli]
MTAPKNGTRATLVRLANLYVQPDESADRMAEVTPGRELVIVERNGKWLRVFANTDTQDTRRSDQPEFGGDAETAAPISGWLLDKGIVDVNTPHGDQILFGEADIAEQAASEPNPPPRVAQEARLLYRRLVEMFPQSPWIAEAMYRAADIRWQTQKADAMTLPSAHEKESYLREQMDEDEMKKVEKYFPHTKWAALAAFDLIDNKLCGDWQGSEKCPEKEADYYLKFADDYPDAEVTPSALYKAAWREASAGDMWASDGDQKRADEDRGRAKAIVQRMTDKYPQSAYTVRGTTLVYKVEQGIPVYGSERE